MRVPSTRSDASDQRRVHVLRVGIGGRAEGQPAAQGTRSAGCKAIIGPLLEGTAHERADFTLSGKKPKGARFIHLLGPVKLDQLTTAAIRNWHRMVVAACGQYTANRAKSHLRAVLSLAEEDFRVRAPALPSGLSKARQKTKKAILTSADIRSHHRRRQGRPRPGHLLRVSLPRRHPPLRAAWPPLVRGRLREGRCSDQPHPGTHRIPYRDDEN